MSFKNFSCELNCFRCTGSYYGAQCEIDGEVLGVAVGSSLVAILIIITTLACLCAWRLVF